VQGPKSAALLSRLSKPDPSDLPYYGFRDTEVAGAKTLVSRTGYTGEDGFEVYCRPEDADRIFRRLLEEGQREGVAPCGLGARDTLRLEAKMALYGNDIDDTVTAYEADLGWIVKPAKGRLPRTRSAPRAEGRRRPAQARGLRDVRPRHRAARLPGEDGGGPGRRHLRHALAHARQADRASRFCPSAASGVGTEFEVEIRGRAAAARVVPTPFYKRPSR
jgi:aminomethyltransferase